MGNRSGLAFNWFKNNNMINSPDKFHKIMLNEKRNLYVICY